MRRVAYATQHSAGDLALDDRDSTAAAPIARDVTLQALYGEDPPLEAYPTADRRRIKAQQDRLARERVERMMRGNDSA